LQNPSSFDISKRVFVWLLVVNCFVWVVVVVVVVVVVGCFVLGLVVVIWNMF